MIAVGLLAVAVLAGHGTEPLVVRTDYEMPAEWAHRGVGGYDFLPSFRSVYWAGSDREIAPLPMYRECVRALSGGSAKKRSALTHPHPSDGDAYARWTDPAERFAKPYTFQEAAGPSLKDADQKGTEKYPFLLGLSGDGQVFFLDESYPLADRASYRAWRAAHPNFLAMRTLTEYDCQAMYYRAFSGRTKDKTVVEQMRKGFPFPPKGTHEQILNRDWASKWVREAVRREREFYFGETNLWSLCSGEPSLQLAMAEAGVSGFYYESTTQGPGSWTVPGAFTRGAARQFGLPFGWYVANFITAYARDGKSLGGENSMSLRPVPGYKHFGKYRGASRSTMRRQATYGWLIGAALVEPENWYHYHMEEVEGEVKGKGEGEGTRCVPSVYAKDLQELCDRAKATDRGDTYTPLAICVPVWNRFYRSYHGQWGLNALFLTLEPPNQEQNEKNLYDLARRNGDESCLFNSPFGGIYDIVAPDATRNRANVRQMLGGYKAAIVEGDFRKEELPPHVFEDYAADGGTLFVSGDKIAKGIVDLRAAGVAFGKKTISSGKRMATVHSSTSTSNFDSSTPLSSPYDVMVPEGTPTAKPLYVDELGNVLVWTKDHGKGRIVTVACDRMLPREYANCAPDHKSCLPKLLAAGRPGFRFDLIHTLLTRIQSETMPVSVDGDIMWGVNRIGVEKLRGGEVEKCGQGWMVWLFNNRGVTKFVGEPEELDESKAATVTVRCEDKSKTVTVGPGAIAYVTFEK